MRAIAQAKPLQNSSIPKKRSFSAKIRESGLQLDTMRKWLHDFLALSKRAGSTSVVRPIRQARFRVEAELAADNDNLALTMSLFDPHPRNFFKGGNEAPPTPWATQSSRVLRMTRTKAACNAASSPPQQS